MCGGIAGALAMRDSARAGAPSRWTLALAYNLARIVELRSRRRARRAAGKHLAARGRRRAALSIAFRVLAGLIMIAAAGRLLFGWRLLDPLEAAGAGLWRRILPRSSGAAQRGGLTGAIGLGLAWGWLPCGLTYSMLLLAATTASALTGALVMAAFGLGTLPAMVGATVAFERAAKVLANRATLRNVAGSLLLLFGAWTAGNAVYHGLMRGQHAGHDMGQDMPAAVSAPADDPHANHH